MHRILQLRALLPKIFGKWLLDEYVQLEVLLIEKQNYILLFCFTVSSTEGLTVTCAAAFEFS